MSLRTPEPEPRSGPIVDVPEPKVGDRIGSYRLVRLIGAGATGRVFEVQHQTIGRRAAMKILAPEHAARPGAIKRLFAEARAVNQINHPHIVQITDLVEAEGPTGVNAIVMELLEGKSLSQLMQAEGVMRPRQFLGILVQVADGLAAAHAARFIHRDLKPENIFLTPRSGQDDYVKLLDFGLAKSLTESMSPTPVNVRSHATAEGVFVGTPAYASPEQVSGKPLDHRTDIYALGIIIYELLTGHLPFDARNFGEYVVKHLTQEPPVPPPHILRVPLGRAVFAVARRCLAKDPKARFGSAEELKDVFERLQNGEEIPDLDVDAGLPPPPSRVPMFFGIGVAVVAAVVAGALFLGRRQQAPFPELPAPKPSALTQPRGPSVVPLIPESTVMVNFESDPPGAETRRIGRPELLGLTPFRQTYKADGARVEFEMRLAGYASRRYSALLTPDQPVRVIGGPLRKVATSRPKPAPSPKPTPHKPKKRAATPNGTLNPFSR